jgi:hypothetical protein
MQYHLRLKIKIKRKSNLIKEMSMRDLTAKEIALLGPSVEDGCYVESTIAELAANGVGGACAGPDLFKDILRFGHALRRVRGTFLPEENCFTDIIMIEGLNEDQALELENALESTTSYLRFDSAENGWSIWEDE